MNSVFWRRVSLILTPTIFSVFLALLGPHLVAAFERGSTFKQVSLSLVAAHLCLLGAFSFYQLWTGRRWKDLSFRWRSLILLYIFVSMGAAFAADSWNPRTARPDVKAVSADAAARND